MGGSVGLGVSIVGLGVIGLGVSIGGSVGTGLIGDGVLGLGVSSAFPDLLLPTLLELFDSALNLLVFEVDEVDLLDLLVI